MFALPTPLKKIMAKLALAVMLTGLFAPMHAVADGNTGTLEVRLNPPIGSYSVYEYVSDTLALSGRTGNINIDTLPVGVYKIIYNNIDGYQKPDSAGEVFKMEQGGYVTLVYNYTPLTIMGTLTVTVDPPAGKYKVLERVSGQEVLSERSGSSASSLPIGVYVVDFMKFSELYKTPEDQTVSITPDQLNISANGVYEYLGNMGSVSIDVTPNTGKYIIQDAVTAQPVVAETVGDKTLTLPIGKYNVIFGDIGNNTQKPDDALFSITPDARNVSVVGIYKDLGNTGTLTVIVNPPSGKYNVVDAVTGINVLPNRIGNQSFTLPFGPYEVIFQPIGNGFIPPTDPSPFNLNPLNKTATVTGNYTTQVGTGTVVVNVINQDHKAITDAKWELFSCTGTALDSCATKVANNTQSITLNALREGTYAIFADLTPAYSGRVVLGSNPLALRATQTIYFNILYTAGAVANHFAGIQVTTQPVAGGIKINGQAIGVPASAGAFIPTPAYQVDVTQANTISFEQVAGYTAPANIVIPAGSLVAGSATQHTGTYQLNDNGNATLALTTTPVAGEIFVDGVSVGTPANAGAVINLAIRNPGDRVVSFGDVANYNKPANQTISVTAQQIHGNAIIPVNGTYTQGQIDTGTVRVNQVGALGTVILIGSSGATVTEANYSNAAAAVGNYTLGTITAPAGFQFLNVTNELGAALTAPYTQTLARNATITFNVRYVSGNKAITVEKTIANEQSMPSNNRRVDFLITLTRNSENAQPITATLDDSMTGGKIVSGTGSLNFTPGTCKLDGIATNDNSCLAMAPMSFDTKGSKHTISYQMTSDNATMTSAVSFVNIATATYTNPDTNLSETSTGQATVAVDAPTPIVNPPSGGGGGGGGGGVGGGHILIKGDMKLAIEKLVSLDGTNFRAAQGKKLAFAIPENKATRIYTKISLKNPGDVSAQNIRFAPFFDQGDSDMTADKIQDLKGATVDNQGRILIEKVKAQETVWFSYSVLIHENGQNVNPAIEGMEVVEISSTLPETQDGLTYKNLGEKVGTTLYAGRIPAAVTVDAEETKPSIPRSAFANGSDVLSIKVATDRSEAAIGDTVNFSVTLENVSDQDLTNLFITHAYPAELSLMNTGGGRDDGHELAWKAPILRPGEKVTKHFVAKVMAGAPGSRLHSLTRVLASEAENITPVDSYLMVLGGAPSSVAKAYHLVQTGPAGLLGLLMLSMLSALAFGAIGKRRALKLKAMALRPL